MLHGSRHEPKRLPAGKSEVVSHRVHHERPTRVVENTSNRPILRAVDPDGPWVVQLDRRCGLGDSISHSRAGPHSHGSYSQANTPYRQKGGSCRNASCRCNAPVVRAPVGRTILVSRDQEPNRIGGDSPSHDRTERQVRDTASSGEQRSKCGVSEDLSRRGAHARRSQCPPPGAARNPQGSERTVEECHERRLCGPARPATRTPAPILGLSLLQPRLPS